MQEMHGLEVKRVETLLRSVQRGLTLLHPAPVDLAECQAAVDAATPETVTTCNMSLEVGSCLMCATVFLILTFACSESLHMNLKSSQRTSRVHWPRLEE